MRYFFQISVLVIAFITHPQITKAQQIFTFQKVIKTVNNANQRFLKFDIYQIDIDAIKSKIDSSSQNSEVETFVFDLPGRDMYSFSLHPHDLRGPNYKLTIATEYGISYSPRSENKTYRGFTSRDHKDVRFTLDNGFMSGIIDLGNDKLIFEPMLSDSSKRSGAKDEVIVYLLSDVINNDKAICATDVAHEHNKKTKINSDTSRDPSEILACKELELALANDFMMYLDYGSNVTMVETQNLSVLNNVETNYDNEFSDNLQFVVNEIFVSTCSTCDPWTSSLDINVVLTDFRSWAPNGFSVNHDVATLWSPRNFFDPELGNGVIGLAYIGVICSFARYNVCEDYSSNPNNLRVLQAHEMGHNFDARHDPAGSGTIMAPTVNNTNTWSTSSINDINAHIASVGCLGPCSAGSPPTAAFEVDQSVGCVPFEVIFSDNSLDSPDSWNWTFEGGTPSTSDQPNPVITYNTPGIYSVTLEVSNDFGNDVLTLPDIVEVGVFPTADFSFDVFEFDIVFTNFSDNYETLFWDFGDGNTSTAANPEHTYDADGVYEVILTVSNACGSDQYILEVEVVTEPTSDFSSSTVSGCAPFTVQFFNESSDNAEVYEWTFEGGNPTTSTSQNPIVSYETPGNYEVSLSVSNNAGSDILIVPNMIEVLAPPNAFFTYVENGFEIIFNAFQGENGTFSWDFGDGISGSGVNTSHTYASAGIYDVILITSNFCGSDTFFQSIELQGAPIPDFTSDVITGCVPLQVQFQNNSNGSVESFEWIFDGGSPATSDEENPTVLYNLPGLYDVQLTVTNSFGSETLSYVNYVEVGDKPSSDFSFVVEGASVVFSNLSENGLEYTWDFGDDFGSNLENPEHTFGSDGVFEVTLFATNQCGVDSFAMPVTIATPPTAAFGVSQVEGCSPLTVVFDNQSSANAIDYLWTFEGGSPASSLEENPVVIYSQPGTYSVQLEVVSTGGTDMVIQSGLIVVLPDPVASFSIDSVNEMSVQFLNESDFGESFFWSFGDGSTSTAVSPFHTYSTFNNFEVELITTNSCSSDTFTRQVELLTEPVTQLTASSTNGCAPIEIQFEDMSLNNPTSWAWSFPGGNPSFSTIPNPKISYASAGVYQVELVTSNGAGSNELVLEDYIHIISKPIAGFEFEVIGTDVLFTNTSGGESELLWNFGNGVSSNLNQTTVTYEIAGEYHVSLIASNACGSDTIEQTVVIALTDIELLTSQNIRIYPNPTSGKIQIELLGYGGKEIKMNLINPLGQLIFQKQILEGGDQTKSFIDLSDFDHGVYYLMVYQAENLFVYPIILQN